MITQILLPLLATLLGFFALSKSADRLTATASTLAKNLGVSPFIIGITVVAFGTSAPELSVSFLAAMNNSSGIAIGNVVGSNIINLGIVLGICGVSYPLMINKTILHRDLPILCAITILATLLCWDGMLTLQDGLILIATLAGYFIYLLTYKNNSENPPNPSCDGLTISSLRAFIESILMLVILILSSRFLVWGTTEIARFIGVSELVIGLTLVAFGTSLPELVTVLTSAKKGMFDIALATILGSNIFNLLAVLPIPALVNQQIVMKSNVHFDLTVMLLVTLLFSLNAWSSRVSSNNQAHKVPVYKNAILLGLTCVYFVFIFKTYNA